jgi:hypothetical protein
MKNLYLINFLGGTAGNFIRQLLVRLITANATDLDLSINNGAHVHEFTYDIPVKQEYWQLSGTEPVYKYFNTLSRIDTKQCIALDHVAPDWDNLFALCPNCKNIIITFPPSMALRVVGNMFFKTICVPVCLPEENKAWQNMRSHEPELSQYTYPEDVPVELLEKQFRLFASQYDNFIVPPYDNSPVPDQYRDRVCCISYYDIIHDMDKVLNQLRDFTGLELPEGIDRVYKQYLDAQDELVKTKMPWVDDK